MTVPWDKYDAACRDYEKNWLATDKVLYALCKKHPDHRSRGSINAKVSIIGRAYATGIERKVSSTGAQGSSINQLSEYFLQCRNRIDAMLERLREVNEPLNPEMLKVILTEHGRFVNLLRPKLKRNQRVRSFVSKYLHFHNPSVPIYDSNVTKALTRLYRWNRSFEIFNLPLKADEDYGRYVLRFWQLYQDARKVRKVVSVKLLDYFLLHNAEGKPKKE